MKTRIHVNQHAIRANSKDGGDRPVITMKTYKENTTAQGATIFCPCGHEVAQVVYSPESPLSCGARVWIETDGKIEAR